MLAESVHSVADSGNQALLLLGGRRAQKAPTADHPFGYGRERYFWAFVVAIILFSLGGMFATYEGIEKIRHPHELESVTVAIVILVVAIILESFSFRTAIVEARKVKDPQVGWWTFIRRSKTPSCPSSCSRTSAPWSASSSPSLPSASPTSPTSRYGTGWARWPSASCSSSSR